MSALPRPDLPPGPHRDLVAALHDLHHRAGWPSLRTLAHRTGVSHTTVSKVFSAPGLPTWGTVELLVEALDGDPAPFHDVWLAASRPEGSPSPTPRIAGRAAELDRVRHHLESGAGLLLVTGEAGLGKTALVTTAAASADVFVAAGHCLPLSTEVPLLPIADALHSIHDQDGGAWLEEALRPCPPYVTSSVARLLPEIATTVPDPEDAWSRQRLFQAVGAVLTEVGARRHVALVIEDLHWADTASLDLLEHLLARGAGVPVLGTWRLDDPHTPAAHQEWHQRIARSGSARLLDLGSLSRDETADLLRQVTDRPIDHAYVDQVYRRSVGHPLFIEQLAIQAPGEPMPRVLSDLLDRRIDGLGADAWGVVTVLAVADRGLASDIIMAVTGMGVAELAGALRGLSDRRLLAAGPAGSQVRLRHPLFAEAVRRRVLAVESRDVHRRLALTLSGMEAASPAEVATHWEAAGDAEQELTWRIRAARAAETRFAGSQAALHWVRALEVWPGDAREAGAPPATRPQAYFGAMDGWDLAGWSSRGQKLAERAMAECSEWDKEDRAEVLRKLAAYMMPGGAAEGDQLTAEAIRLYRECPQTPAVVDRLAIALIHQAFTFSLRGRAAESAAALDEARSLLAGLRPVSSRLRELRAQIAWQDAVDGHLERALQDLSALSTPSSDRREPVPEVLVAMHHSDVLLMAGTGAEEVEAVAQHGLAAAREHGLDTYESNTLLVNVAIAWIRAGRIQRAAAHVDALTDGDLVRDRWLLHLQRAVLDLARGRLDEARERADRLHALDGVTVEFMAASLALVHLWTGHPGRSLDLIEAALLAPDHIEVNGEAGQMLVLGARAAADLHRRRPSSSPAALSGRVRRLHAAAYEDPFRTGAVPVDRHAAPQWAAELARLDGTETVAHWTRAAASWDSLVWRHEAAYCRWRGAQVALQGGQGTVARRLLRRAAADSAEHVPLSGVIATTAHTAV